MNTIAYFVGTPGARSMKSSTVLGYCHISLRLLQQAPVHHNRLHSLPLPLVCSASVSELTYCSI